MNKLDALTIEITSGYLNIDMITMTDETLKQCSADQIKQMIIDDELCVRASTGEILRGSDVVGRGTPSLNALEFALHDEGVTTLERNKEIDFFENLQDVNHIILNGKPCITFDAEADDEDQAFVAQVLDDSGFNEVVFSLSDLNSAEKENGVWKINCASDGKEYKLCMYRATLV
ncbi:hypothetical protein [Vibrio metschnikovii]|uniref:Uncharacterized protein n=1 Tax=Vibrio metschnikovii TaxID=28172 RepID=A0A9X0RB83_VIBME|nr:hypothetical protein [Vibrio metschnikovii]MBC5853183.1 hypothetical protein [Vibrio metschnikovii]